MYKYAVIGNPIQHSKSPQIHSAFAQQESIKIDYQRILAEKQTFSRVISNFNSEGGLGLNITVPFKIQAYEICDELNQFAQSAKAVNTISFDKERGLVGYNTDGIGLLRDLKNNLNINLTNKDILILGAGGATQGILLPLLQETPAAITIANRTINKALDLAKIFEEEGKVFGCGYETLGSKKFDIVINATSASLKKELPPISNSIVDTSSVCYDLAYSDTPTPFLNWANEQNVQLCIDGIGMLIEQAAESYRIWRGFMPSTKEVFNLLRP